MRGHYTFQIFTFFVWICLLLFGQCSKKDSITEDQQLQLTSYFPNSGKAGTLVRIIGVGFGTDITSYDIMFGGVQGEVLGISADELIVRAPESGKTGKLLLKYNGEDIEIGDYTYQDLSVHNISPERAQVGAHLRIHGEGFGSMESPPVVMVNGVAAEIMNATDTLLVVEVPRSGSGSGPVVVQVDGSESIGPIFSFMAIRSIKPLSGGKGTRVTIKGEGFETLQTGNVVTFNGKTSVIVENSVTELVVVAPDEVETGPVIVSVNGDPIIGPEFTSVPLPKINFVNPLSGPVGTQVTVKGEYYSATEDETFIVVNGIQIIPTSVTATEIKFTVPEGVGTGDVQVLVNDRYSLDGPEFRTQNLGVTSFSPVNGLAGTEVSISGTGFSSTAGDNNVTFNGVPAIVRSATNNTLQVIVPEDISSGRIRVSTSGLDALSAEDFIRAGVFTLADASSGLHLANTGGTMAIDDNGNVYVTDYVNNRIMKVSSGGQVSHFAGSLTGLEGLRDGQGDAALFRLSANAGLILDDQQNLYVADDRNQALRRISPQGRVTTLIENIGLPIGKMNIHKNGELYISANGNNMVVVNLTSGTFRSVTGSGSFAIRPVLMSNINSAGYGDLYDVYSITDSYNRSRIFKHTGLGIPMGQSSSAVLGSTSASYLDGTGTSALFNQIHALTLYEGENSMLVLDAGNYALRLVNLTTLEVTTAMKLVSGYADGDFRQAKMSLDVWDMVMDKDGALYMLDCGNSAIRKVLLK